MLSVKVALAAAKRIAAAMAKVDAKDVAPLNAAIKKSIDSKVASGAYKKAAAVKKAAVKAPTPKPKPATKEVVGRTLRKKAEVRLTPKDPAIDTPKNVSEVITKEKYLKQVTGRPVIRNRDIAKRSSKSLTPREKRYEKLGEKAPVRVTRVSPSAIKLEKKRAADAAEAARVARSQRPARPNPKPNSLYDPKSPRNPKARKPTLDPNRPVRPPKTKYLTKEERKQWRENKKLLEAQKNEANWDVADIRRNTPSNIAEGRGNIEQPPSLTTATRNTKRVTQMTTREKRAVREKRRETRLAREADARDRKTDIEGAKRADWSRPRRITYVTGPKSAKPGTKKRVTIGTQTVSRTNHPENAIGRGRISSDAGNMQERLKEINQEIRFLAKKHELYKGNNKISPKEKAKIYKTLGQAKRTKKRLELQNTFNKPVITRTKSGKVRVKSAIKPALKPRLSKTRPKGK